MITRASLSDLHSVTDLAGKLWPNEDRELLREDFTRLIIDDSSAVFVYQHNNIIIGFIHVSLRREYVEGSSTSPVGYIEGIFVDEDYRGQKFGRALVKAADQWARDRGCREMGSDVEIQNVLSQEFHKRSGFTEASRLVMYIKTIG